MRKDYIALSKEESDKLGAAAENVARHYDLKLLSPKQVDWINLAGCLAMVYSPRIVMFVAEKKMQEKPKEKKEDKPQNKTEAENTSLFLAAISPEAG